MKLRALFLCAAASAATLAATLGAGELVEGIVARVNDKLITQSEYDKRLAATRQGARADNNVRIVVLEDMIKEKLLEERAKEMSVTATDEEIDAAVARVKAQYNLSTDQDFENALAQTGLTKDELRRQMRENITLQKVIGREVASRIDQSDDALRLEYERQKEKLYATPETAHVAEIVLKFNPNDPADRQQAAQRAEELRQRIAKGAPFADLAKEFSQGTTKDRGGDLGLVSKGELVESLDNGIFVNPPAEYPPPVVTADSIHLFHVTEHKAAGYRPFAEVKEDLKKRISDDLYEKRFTEYMEHLRRDAYVKIYDPDLAKADEQAAKQAEEKKS
jgi:parvulin-like peptidyl-prolyl isomerase